jgi:hypothetical protein
MGEFPKPGSKTEENSLLLLATIEFLIQELTIPD